MYYNFKDIFLLLPITLIWQYEGALYKGDSSDFIDRNFMISCSTNLHIKQISDIEGGFENLEKKNQQNKTNKQICVKYPF